MIEKNQGPTTGPGGKPLLSYVGVKPLKASSFCTVPSSSSLLDYIRRHPGQNLTEIAQAFGLNRDNVRHRATTREIHAIIARMEVAGLIVKESWRFTITEKGERVIP